MTDTHPETHEMGTVHHLDDHRTTAVTEGPAVSLVKATDAAPLEGTVIPAPAQAPDTVPGPVPAWARTVRTVRVVATHDRTRTTGRAVVRHGMYVASGAAVVARRTWDGRTAARYERMMRTAEAAGKHETALEWETRAAAFRSARHQRRMDLLKAPQRIAKGALVGTGVTAGGLLALGIVAAVAEKDVSLVLAPTMAVVEAVNWLMFIIAVVWGPLVAMAPWLAVLSLWSVGRARGQVPVWAMSAKERSDTAGAPITPSIVVTAVRDLGVASLRKSIKEMEDSGASMLGPISIAGCGVEVDVTLPSGSSTEEVMSRRRKLAENLNRHEHEVHISVAPVARTVRLWIADSGALDVPVPASPLVVDTDMTANYKSGRAPWGLNLRGDAALLSLYQRHLLITGLSNQGKTASLRALALWLALDPTVEFRIGDLKGIGDWGMFEGLATLLIEGPTDDHVADVTVMVEDAFDEMQRRLQAPATDYPPLVIIVDEAQVAYGSAAKDEYKVPYGGAKANSRYFRAVKGIHDQGRAVNVTIWEGTQDPTNENLPKRSREGNHIRASLVLGTESQACMAVGESAVEAGAAPHKLRQGLDKGQVVVAGDGLKLEPGQTSMNVRTHYVDGDEAKVIAERAKQRRAGTTTQTGTDPDDKPDALADITAVLGNEPRMRTQTILQRLAALNSYYRDWNFISLKSALDKHDAAPHKSDGYMVVDAAKLARALSARTTEADSA